MSTVVSGCVGGKGQLPVADNETGGHPHGHSEHAENGHRFADPDEWVEVFESPERDAWQQPDRIVAQLELEPADVVAEIGSGTGYFAVRLARAVPDGRVWGVDIEPKMVAYVNRRARGESLSGLYSVLGTETDPLIPEPVDLILLANTYHHIEDRSAYVKTLAGYLRPGGRVAIVEFKKGDLPIGPPDEMKLSPDEVRAEFEGSGYRLHRIGEELDYHYILIFQRTNGA